MLGNNLRLCHFVFFPWHSQILFTEGREMIKGERCMHGMTRMGGRGKDGEVTQATLGKGYRCDYSCELSSLRRCGCMSLWVSHAPSTPRSKRCGFHYCKITKTQCRLTRAPVPPPLERCWPPLTLDLFRDVQLSFGFLLISSRQQKEGEIS